MDCPRCDEPNLPGMLACVMCGRALGEDAADDPDPPGGFVPRVRTVNPLQGKPSLLHRRSLAEWIKSGPVLRLLIDRTTVQQAKADARRAAVREAGLGVFWGFVPGLAAWRRDQTRLALMQVGAVALGGLLVAAMWTSQWFFLACWIPTIAWAWSPAQELQHRLPAVEPTRTIAVLLLVFAASLVMRLMVFGAFSLVYPQLYVAADRLPAGQFLIERFDDGDLPRIGSLVVLGEGGGGMELQAVQHHVPGLEEEDFFNTLWALRLVRADGLVVAPVIAHPGSEVEIRGARLYVDGAPSPCLPMNDEVGLPETVEPFTLGSGELAVFALPLAPTPFSQVAGRPFYRWTPANARGPLVWPPPDETAGPEEP